MRVLERYKKDSQFKSIVDSLSVTKKIPVNEILLRIEEMEVGLKKVMESPDNRDIYLKYIGSFSLTHRGLSRKLKYFIRLCRKGFLPDKNIIRKTFYDLKEKNIQRIERKKEIEKYRKNKK